MTDTPNSPIETTPEGEQFIAPGVGPVTLATRLAVRAAQPIAPKRNPGVRQKPCDIGFFDEVGRNQIDLFDLLRAASDGGAAYPKPKE